MKNFILFATFSATLASGCSSGNFKGSTTVKPVTPAASTSDETPTPAETAAGAAGNSAPAPETTNDTASVPKGAMETDDGVVFGTDELFHVGDNRVEQTSCKTQISSYELSGKTFHFVFSVLEDDTAVDLTIGKICGIDDSRSNSVSLDREADNKTLGTKILPLTVNDTFAAFSPFTTFHLAKGIYTIQVVSNLRKSVVDFDDFLVGSIKVKADKKVKAIKIFTD